MAPSKKNAARLKAALVFVDESGFMMAPLVRRTWAPKGATPVLYQRGRSHQKVTAIAALYVPPERNGVRCCFRLHPDANINTSLVLSFLQQLSRQLKGKPFLVIWDRLNCHRAKSVTTFLSTFPAVGVEFLPPYAPELNPVEFVWGYLKTNPLANNPYLDVESLATAARRHGRSLQRRGCLLRSFIEHNPLFLCLR
ncbi:MAG: IS630 family transposase [bacterium]